MAYNIIYILLLNIIIYFIYIMIYKSYFERAVNQTKEDNIPQLICQTPIQS